MPRRLLVVIVLSIAAVAQGPDTVPPHETYQISGTVVQALTGQPIAKAAVGINFAER